MAIGPMMPGTRLSFVVVKLDGTLTRQITTWTKKEGLVKKEMPVPAGNLVYFPRGHVLRLSDEQLVHYNLNKKPRMINLQGLHDPESPVGKMMMAQDDATRANAYNDLEQAVMHLAIAKSGPVIMPEMVKKMRFVEAKDYTTKNKVA